MKSTEEFSGKKSVKWASSLPLPPPPKKKGQDRKSNRTRQKNKMGNSKMESNDNHEIPDTGEDIGHPRPPFGLEMMLLVIINSIIKRRQSFFRGFKKKATFVLDYHRFFFIIKKKWFHGCLLIYSSTTEALIKSLLEIFRRSAVTVITGKAPTPPQGVSRCGLAVRRLAGKQDHGSIRSGPPFSSLQKLWFMDTVL